VLSSTERKTWPVVYAEALTCPACRAVRHRSISGPRYQFTARGGCIIRYLRCEGCKHEFKAVALFDDCPASQKEFISEQPRNCTNNIPPTTGDTPPCPR